MQRYFVIRESEHISIAKTQTAPFGEAKPSRRNNWSQKRAA
jgi:hypothetical protein